MTAGVTASTMLIDTAGVVEVAAMTAGETVTPVPCVMVGAGTVEVQAIVGISSVSLTLIVPPGTVEVQAITAGETVTPVPCVMVGAGTVEVQATTPGVTVTPLAVVTVTAGTVEVQAIVVALTVTFVDCGILMRNATVRSSSPESMKFARRTKVLICRYSPVPTMMPPCVTGEPPPLDSTPDPHKVG